MADSVSNKPWDGSSSRYADASAYCSACLIDDNASGQQKVIAKCHLPVREPGGAVNANAVKNAAARINQVQSPSKGEGARKLIRLYGVINLEPPNSLKEMAGQAVSKAMNSAVRKMAGK